MGLLDNKGTGMDEKPANMNDEIQLMKFEKLVSDIQYLLALNCNARVNSCFFNVEKYEGMNSVLSLLFDKGNRFSMKLISQTSSGLNFDIDGIEWQLCISSTEEKLKSTKIIVDACRQEDNIANHYLFIFWSLMILAVDKNQGEGKLSLVCDFAKLVEITDDEMEDLVLVVKLVLKQDISGLSLKTETVKNRFEHVIAKYES